MELFRWIVTGVLGFLALYIMVVNNGIFIQGYFLKKETPSWIPLLGGGLGACALLVCPVPGTGSWWWAPLLLDFGCLPGALFTGWYYLRHWQRERGKRER